jgi:predicted transcriptional regulator
MTTSEATSYYKTQELLAAALGITQSAVSMWGEYPPAMRQMQIERLTRGRLRAEPNVFDRKRKKAA